MGGVLVTLLTDFGTADGYVGEMKGALLSRAPGATVVDIAHDLPAHDVTFARITVARYWEAFPAGTIHVVVVDPGVGSSRSAIAVESEGRFLVGPDNGVLSAALLGHDARAVRLDVPAHASPTFHGRDVFAPAAARLATGTKLGSLGDAILATVMATPDPEQTSDGWRGEVIAIDRFGNAITNLRNAGARVTAAGRACRVVRTYADLAPAEAGALIGSSGLVEIVVREGRAADTLGLRRGASVESRS